MKKAFGKKIVFYGIVGIFIFLSVFPIYYLFLTSVKPANLLLVSPPRLFCTPDFRLYPEVFIKEGYIRHYGNSVLVAGMATILALLIGSFASFAIAKSKSKATVILFFLIVITRAYMPVTTIIPLYLAGRYLRLLDTRLFLVLAYTSFQLPLAVIIMTNFISTIPSAIQESAEIDGCSPVGIFFRIILPLGSPGFLAAAILIFIFCWQEFLFALVTTTVHATTAPVFLAGYLETEAALLWRQVSTIGFLMIIPVLIFAILLNKFLVQGLSAGAVKE
ncbi:Diacetylchitobiose uptake system permease protein DasC [subsurface metagenome]